MSENNESETNDRGMLEGGGSGGGSERVGEHRPREERGGSRYLLYAVIAIAVLFLIFPVLRLLGVVFEASVFTIAYTVALVLIILIAIPTIYQIIKGALAR